MSKKIKMILCPKLGCYKEFKTQRGVNLHVTKSHPYVPQPVPEQKTLVSKGEQINQTLLGALNQFELGDVYYRVEKLVIKRITKTEGSDNLEVGAELISSYYQRKKPE